jgi:hypothetical protein
MPPPQPKPPMPGTMPTSPTQIGGAESLLPVPTQDPLLAQADDLYARHKAALQEQSDAYKQPDRKAMTEAYGKRAAAGDDQMLLAMAAQQAGPSFAPMQAHFLKQSAAAQEPMKMAGGTMTPQGFVEDPGYQTELAAKRSDAKVKAIESALQQNLTAQERRRLEVVQAQEKARHEQVLLALGAMRANGSGSDVAGGGEVGTTPQGAPVFRTKNGSLITYEAGQPRPYTGDIGSKREGEGHAAADERLAAGFHQRMVTVAPMIDALEAKGKMNATTQNLSHVPLAGDYLRTLASSPDQQQYYRAAMDWIRAKLRKESGAVIGEKEAADEFATYFPMPGEGPEVAALKRQARRTAESAMMTAAGRASDKAGAMPGVAPPPAGSDSHPEGSTATGPGGQKMVKRGGVWVPL